MRKLMIILTLAMSLMAVSATVNGAPPPDCYPNCQLAR